MDRITQKELFVIHKLGLSLDKNSPLYYKTNAWYKKWKKDLFVFYDLIVKKEQLIITNKELNRLNKLTQKLIRNNIL